VYSYNYGRRTYILSVVVGLLSLHEPGGQLGHERARLVVGSGECAVHAAAEERRRED